MARVLFAAPMDAERRSVLASMVSGDFEPVILEDLATEQRDAAWARADVLVCSGFGSELPLDLPSRAPNLHMVQTLVAGVDHLPFDRMPPRAIVCSNAGAYNMSVAEHAMALMLAAAKDIPRRTDEIRRGVFDQEAPSKALRGSTLLVLGLGGIGMEVARLAQAFGMTVLGIARSDRPYDFVDEIGTLADLRRFAARADAVVIALPLTRETDGLVNRDVLAVMKDDAILVNIARGKIVVEDDLFEHLRAHPNFRAALDVWWTYPDGKEGRPFHRPFHELPNVVMTPHIAFANPGQRRVAMEAALANVLRFLRGQPAHHVVDPSDYVRRPAARA